MWEALNNFFSNNEIVKIIIDGVIIFWLLTLLLTFVFKNQKAMRFVLPCGLLIFLYFFAKNTGLKSAIVLQYVVELMPIFLIVTLSPEIRRTIEMKWRNDVAKEAIVSSSQETKQAIIDAVMALSSTKTGALITIEKHTSLDQYAERAIQMNAEVSKELLINIFEPNTPLHDGGVIIKGNKIRCAGAYYVLTQESDLEKTMGSRHRAGLGISEVSDSLTIIVSEETGNVSITTEGILISVKGKEKLLEYIEMFIK